MNVTFSELAGTEDEAIISRAIELYRERYIPIGYRENQLYEGIVVVLDIVDPKNETMC
ncbi:MAG: hypothetical protein GY755_08495 [Chloroflexi bacterium]|nr:hypothetical protein [Chloroflexota bacterium]